MRLKEDEKQVIVQAIKKFDSNACIYLFGSRVDNAKRGGDIDILVISKKLTYDDKIKIKSIFFKKLDDQKIDLIIYKNTKDPFVQLILKPGASVQL